MPQLSRKPLQILYGIAMVIMLTAPLLVGLFLKWRLGSDSTPEFVAVSVYSLANLLHFAAQLTAAILNRRVTNHWRATLELNPDTSYGVLVVGRQENPAYFRACLEGVSRLQNPAPRGIWVVIDGNDPEEDLYMVDIVMEVLGGGATLTCIAQPAAGKRAAMYRALNADAATADSPTYMLCTDSDTVITPETPAAMKQILDNVPRAAAVTGNVRIFNLSNFLTHMINMKYWFAFNLERAAQSYFGCVSCVSGPLGMYRMDAIRPLLDSWRYQRFCCNQEATYGDDRHLTNLLLSAGHQIYYTHHAECATETPSELLRWFTQQTRWGRSFVREFLLNVGWFWRVSWWLTYDLVYLAFYSLFLFVFAVVLLAGEPSTETLLNIFIVSLIMAFLRALYAVILERSMEFLLFAWFGALYFVTLLPLKIWSALTVFVVTWGTSTRRRLEVCHWWNPTNFFDSWPVFIWGAFVMQAIIRAGFRDGGARVGALWPEWTAVLSFLGFSVALWYGGGYRRVPVPETSPANPPHQPPQEIHNLGP